MEKELYNKIIEKTMVDEVFKEALKDNPRAALKSEFGIELDSDIEVIEETEEKHYLVLPVCPLENATSDRMW